MFGQGVILLSVVFIVDRALADIHRTLAIVWAERNASVLDVWENKTSDVITTNNFTNAERLLRNLRSGVIDNWDSNVPTSVYVTLQNMQGDELGYIEFNATESSSSMTSWFIESRIIRSSLTSVSSQTVKLQHSDNNFEIYLSDINNPADAWFGATSRTSSNFSSAFPLFLLSKNVSSAYYLKTESTSVRSMGYIGCWHYTTLTSSLQGKDILKMTVEKCSSMCSSTGNPLVLLHIKSECHCGYFINKKLRDDALCLGYCTGNPKQICGQTPGMYATYEIEIIKFPAPQVPAPVTPLHTVTQTIDPAKITWLEVDLSSYRKADLSPVYVTSVFVNASSEIILQYGVTYKIRTDSNWHNYTDFDGNIVTFDAGIRNDLTVLPAIGFGILFLSTTQTKPFELTLEISSAGDEHFIQAPLLKIQAVWKQDIITPDTLTTPPTTEVLDATTVPLYETTSVLSETTTTVPSLITTDLKDETTTVPSLTSTELKESTSTAAPDTSTSDYPNTDQSTATSSADVNTDNEVTSTTTLSSACAFINGSACECSCLCYSEFNTTMSFEELQEKLKELRVLLLLNKKELSSYVNRLVSADDKRPSAKRIGGFGAAILISVVCLIVTGDLVTLARYYLQK